MDPSDIILYSLSNFLLVSMNLIGPCDLYALSTIYRVCVKQPIELVRTYDCLGHGLVAMSICLIIHPFSLFTFSTRSQT